MVTKWLVIHRASYLLKKITEAYIGKYQGKFVDEKALWFIIGAYQSRKFGLCIYRPSESDDKLIEGIMKIARQKLKSTNP